MVGYDPGLKVCWVIMKNGMAACASLGCLLFFTPPISAPRLESDAPPPHFQCGGRHVGQHKKTPLVPLVGSYTKWDGPICSPIVLVFGVI